MPRSLAAALSTTLVLWCSLAQAQPRSHATLTGTVVDSTTGDPLSGAHVFIAASMIGTTTDTTGHFRLAGVPLGAQRLYVSMLGYASATVDTLLQQPTTYTFDFRLEPTVLEAGEVTVTAERDEEWWDRLKKFKRLFLGESKRTDHCTLLNPEVLQFEDGWFKPFHATATEPLVIVNNALGYRVTYFLDEFSHSGGTTKWDGEPLFEPIVPKDSAEAARWARNRRRAFYGSMRHFLLALLDDRVREEGFILYRHPHTSYLRPARFDDTRFRASADRLLSPHPDSSLHTLDFNGRLEIIYTEEREEERFLRWQHRLRDGPGPQRSFIELNDPSVTIDPTGEIVEPYGATVFGYFAFERLADLLPQEYRPNQ